MNRKKMSKVQFIRVHFILMLLIQSLIAVAAYTCPKEILSWDITKNNISTATSAATAYVEAKRSTGHFGVHMFQFAAQIIFAVNKGLALYVAEDIREEFYFFPCLRSSRGIESLNRSSLINVQPPGGEYFQNISLWGDLEFARNVLQDAFFLISDVQNSTSEARDMTLYRETASSLEAHLAAIMEGDENSESSGKIRNEVGPIIGAATKVSKAIVLADDLIIHFKSFAYSGRHQSRDQVSSGTETDAVLCHSHGQYSLCAPPFLYYARVVRRHIERFGANKGRVLIVCEPKQRSHATIKRLVKQFGARVITQDYNVEDNLLHDFFILREAKHLVLSPCAYGWWAAYLSRNAQEVYFPIMRGRVLFPWCSLIPLASETTSVRARYVYEDWWQGESLRLNGTGTTIISTINSADRSSLRPRYGISPQLPSAMARQRCREYETFLVEGSKQQERIGQLELFYKSFQQMGNATAKVISKSDIANAGSAISFASFGAGGI